MKSLRKAYLGLTNLGITPDTRIEEAQRIRLVNILSVSPVPIALFFTWYGLHVRVFFMSILCGTLLLSTVIGLAFSYHKKTGIAKSIVLCVNSLGIFIGYNS